MIHFLKTDLSLGNPDDHAKGMFHTVAVKHLGQEAFALDTPHNAVVRDCERKARARGQFDSLEEALRRKAITRATADGWLAAIRNSVESPDWSSVPPHLSFPVAEMGRMEREWGLHKIKRLGTNEAVRAIQDRVRRYLGDADCSGLTHMPLLKTMTPKVDACARDRFNIDQDNGWNDVWASFSGFAMIPSYKKDIAAFHTGIRPREVLRGEAGQGCRFLPQIELRLERNALGRAERRLKEKRRPIGMGLDPST